MSLIGGFLQGGFAFKLQLQMTIAAQACCPKRL